MKAAVHLACGAVEALLRDAPEPGQWLSVDERGRLAALTTPRRRDQFVAARWQARWLLAQAFGGMPAQWQLGAPRDAPPSVLGRPNLQLSISHSGGWAACAVAGIPIGLDLEAPHRRRDVDGLIALCCTPREQALLQAAAGREALFYEIWTVKEAWLKRGREWIAPSRLQQLDASLADDGEVRTWAGDGWRLALCVEGLPAKWWTAEPALGRRWRVLSVIPAKANPRLPEAAAQRQPECGRSGSPPLRGDDD